MELWDLYDGNRQLLGRLQKRGEHIKRGDYHIVVDIWTVNSKQEILLTLRDPNKECFPNLWENSAGSILAGETSVQGAVRELFEETGIKAEENELNFLGELKEETAFIDTYIIRKDVEISELVMQESETVDAQWVTLGKLDEMINSGMIAEPVGTRLIPLRKAFEKFLFSK
ncbi:MAG: hypothetical protein A2Y17_06745 [Clostridiales bacterium GWF2_38_85]|nr:MAG: hypothetical protein A2Y17_06745 [Clostridiales bacterium GWF2_38_85]